jgi:hypothetical protein
MNPVNFSLTSFPTVSLRLGIDQITKVLREFHGPFHLLLLVEFGGPDVELPLGSLLPCPQISLLLSGVRVGFTYVGKDVRRCYSRS